MNAGTTRPQGCARRSAPALKPPALTAWMAGAALTALMPGARALAQCDPVIEIPGVNGPVHAMTNWDPDGAGPLPPLLVVGGKFTVAGSIDANHIAAWNPTTRRWSALGSGMGGSGDLTAVN